MDTGRAIVPTAQLGITLHAACNAWRNAIIKFFTPFDPAPCDKKSSEHQTLFLARAGRVWARDYVEFSTYRNAFQSSNLIGCVRVNLGCCYGNAVYAYINMYNKLTNRDRALKSTSGLLRVLIL